MGSVFSCTSASPGSPKSSKLLRPSRPPSLLLSRGARDPLPPPPAPPPTPVSPNKEKEEEVSALFKTPLATGTEGKIVEKFMSSNDASKTATLTQNDVKESPQRSQTSSWKFWRTLSTKRTEKKTRASVKHTASTRGGRLADWTHPSHLDLRPPNESKEAVKQSSVSPGGLPDVLDKAVVKRSSSVRAPPKPPRLFLFRSSSAHRSPTRPGHGIPLRSPVVEAPGGETEMGAEADTEPIYVNSAFGATLKTGLSGNDRIIPPTINVISNKNGDDDDDRAKGARDGREKGVGERPRNLLDVPREQAPVRRLSHNSIMPLEPRPSSIPMSPVPSSYHSLPHRQKPRQRVASADLPSQRLKDRSRRKSTLRPEHSSHQYILQNVLDLLCQKLDPFPLLDSLQSSGVLTAMDVQAFMGHPDRRLVCEKLVNIICDGDYSLFTAFLEVLRTSGDQDDIVSVMEVIRDMDGLIHDLPSPTDSAVEEETPVLAEEKVVSYEIGYLASDGVSLKPIVELERVRSSDRRVSRAMPPSSLSPPVTAVDNYNDSTKKNDARSGDVRMSSLGPVMVNIYVTGYSLSGQGAVALAQILRHHDCILELRIGKTQLCSADLVAVCGALLHNSSLASLDIRLNTLDFVGVSAVASVLTQTRALRQLNLSSTGVDAPGIVCVLSALMSNRTLTDLDLSFLNAGDAVCESVRDMLSTNTCLQKLRLRSINISAAGCRAIAEGLARNRSLLELDLSRNYLGDEGIEALARYIPESSLTDVSLENCSMTSAAGEPLSRMISGSKRLRSLDLSVNYLGDDGVKRLGAALERSSMLHTVALNMCGITNDGFSILLDVLEKNTSIFLLKLCYNHLGREHLNPAATSDNLRYRLRIVTSSKPTLKILLWGNSFDTA